MKMQYPASVECWGVWELAAHGRSDGNPFTDYRIIGEFESKNEKKTVDGFYDGDGVYKVRFMPSFIEEYSFRITGSYGGEPITGRFSVLLPRENNHGPVKVAGCYHFAYADGTPYYPVGTTCYVWTHQPQEIQEQTLQTLAEGHFNKVRMCILPKSYLFNVRDPITFPYEGTPCDATGITNDNVLSYLPDHPGNHWDFTRFNPAHFQNLERRIADLMALGIEADLIAMHCYDRWGFSTMMPEQDDLYWRYIIARFAAYRNVWWSLANEYDLMTSKTNADWERYAKLLCDHDPYCRLRSIHNCVNYYDFTSPWVTHCCVQRQDYYKGTGSTAELRIRYDKPVIFDEISYEGNVPNGWGNISGEELMRRTWEAVVRGGYASHGETYNGDYIWWSHGGRLYGESHHRMKFMHEILKKTPGLGLRYIYMNWDEIAATAENGAFYYLIYFAFWRPSSRELNFGDEPYVVELIDTWEMTTEVVGTFMGKAVIPMPSKPYMALRIYRPETD